MKKLVPDPPFAPTCARAFGDCSSSHPPIFTVNPGIAPHCALLHASMLLSCACECAQECADPDASGKHFLWLMMHAVEAAKGLVDGLLEGLEKAEWEAVSP